MGVQKRQDVAFIRCVEAVREINVLNFWYKVREKSKVDIIILYKIILKVNRREVLEKVLVF